ncbi:MAG: T9SS type A sorting domain-containing protein, partial [Ignavibacteriaceae bacterium]|nr:T9SS type A sorting domain-containing protein [Ignavibacteriaceae bacterium]
VNTTSAQNTTTIQINNNGPGDMNWVASSFDPWLQFVGDSSGTNSGTITVNVNENLYCPRNGRIIVRAPGALYSPREVFIHQKAGPGTNEVKLFSNDPNNADWFGWSVDIDGDYAIIGAVGDNEFGNLTGAAYIFERDGCCSWVQKAKLHISDAQPLDKFGQDVAICEDFAVVGCHRGSTGYDEVAFLFEKPAGGWEDMTETARLYPSQGTWAPGFGEAIDMSGEYIIIGAKDGSKIFFYEKPESGWQDMEEKIYFSQPNSRYFGITVAIDGAYAVVGTEYDEYGSAGAAYVYKLDWNWGYQTKLVASDGQPGDAFGTSVDIDNDRIIVGDKEKEAAYIFVRENDIWYEEQKLTGGYSFANGVKNCVSINGDYALVGAWENSDSTYLRTGSAFSFVRTDLGWSFSKQIFNSDLAAEDHFGSSVSMSGPYTIISAHLKDNLTMNDVGAAYIYCTEGDIVTSVSTPPEQTLPVSYDLKQNYPNPFNPITTIVFDLPRPTNVTLKIYTILGEEVTTLVSEELKAGTHKYIWNPVSLASGVYLYRIESKEYTLTKKMVFLK